jgi:hypothetical protein
MKPDVAGSVKNAKTARKISLILILVIICAVIFAMANMDVSIRQGIDGNLRIIHMPLYVKWTEFLARHYEYERLAREITANCRTDEDKAIAILNWTRKNIKDQPSELPVVDDHILNIIIRGYGIPGQLQDVFTTICSYAGMPAYWGKPYDKSHKARYVVSLVKINGKWRVFDAYQGLYFRTKAGEIASIDNIINDPSILSGKEIGARMVNGVPYKDFFQNLEGFPRPETLRSERQMPLPRILFELRRAARMGRGEDQER